MGVATGSRGIEVADIHSLQEQSRELMKLRGAWFRASP